MDLCDNALSWDGVLCSRCRQLYDSHIVRMAHEQGLCRGEMHQGNSELSTAPRNEHDRSQDDRISLWWHSISSLRKCATGSCKLCTLALSSIEGIELENLESWEATLPAEIFLNKQEAHEFRVFSPRRDPRPEAEIFDQKNMNYIWIIVIVRIQDVLGKMPSPDTLETADRPFNPRLIARTQDIEPFHSIR